MKQDNIGIAVVGAGRIGTLRARLAAKHPAVRFLAISDRDPARARALAAEAGADVYSGSNDEVISHPQVTAVIVSTPEQQHTQPILKALELGKPVLVEKPIGFSLREAARGASLKAIKLGGMRGATEAGRLCDALGLKVNVSAKTGESSIACAAAMHIAAALPQIAWGLTLTNEGLADDVTTRPVRIARGHVELSDRPGLGIDVDEDRVRRYRRDVPVRQVA